MKGCLFLILTASIITAIGITPAIGKSDCAEPIPELFQRVSRSVVSISALALDPSKISGRISTVSGSGFHHR